MSQSGLVTKKIFQANLERNAYNMVLGTFGGSKKTMVCVQSCDGMLSVYENDKLSCCVQLNDFLLPGSISYNPIIDSFVV